MALDVKPISMNQLAVLIEFQTETQACLEGVFSGNTSPRTKNQLYVGLDNSESSRLGARKLYEKASAGAGEFQFMSVYGHSQRC